MLCPGIQNIYYIYIYIYNIGPRTPGLRSYPAWSLALGAPSQYLLLEHDTSERQTYSWAQNECHFLARIFKAHRIHKHMSNIGNPRKQIYTTKATLIV